jgi:uncharacterized protein YuzE
MKLQYDAEADAIYIRLNEALYAYGDDLDAERRIDYADDRRPVGIELLCVSTGVDLQGLPEKQVISDLLANHGVDVITS